MVEKSPPLNHSIDSPIQSQKKREDEEFTVHDFDLVGANPFRYSPLPG
jgi:hypothetical protein